MIFFFFFQAEDGIRDVAVTGVQTCALPISHRSSHTPPGRISPSPRGQRTALRSRTALPAACPEPARTGPAATGPCSSSYTGYPTTAASTTWRSPCPGVVLVPLPAPRAPPAARPWRRAARPPAHHGPRPPRAVPRSRPPVPPPAHAAPPRRAAARTAYQAQATMISTSAL